MRFPWTKRTLALPAAQVPETIRKDNNWDGLIGTPGIGGFGSGGGWLNPVTGLGTFSRDKVLQAGYWQPIRIPDPELAALFNGNDLARRIVSKKPEEMFRRGYQLAINTEDDGDQNEAAQTASELEDYAANLRLNTLVKQGLIFGRLFGGALLIVGADDGADVATPLREDSIRSVRYLNLVDRRFLYARDYYSDPFSPNFGEVETYQVTNAFGDQQNTIVHESRVIRFEGAEVDILMRRQLAGWTLSVLQAPYDTMRQFDQSFQAVANLMVDMSQAVMKIQGLVEMITSGHVTELQNRMKMTDMTRSSGRMVLLDAENEDFERKATPMTGIPETLDRMMMRMAAASEGMPVTILFGRSAAGLNATGDNDMRGWYDVIASEQETVLEPKLRRLFDLICLADDSPTGGVAPDNGLEFNWHKLQAPTELELAQLHQAQATADNLYIQNGTLLPEEVALSRFRDAEFCLETTIDVETREKALAAETDYMVQEKEGRAEAGPPDPLAPNGEPSNTQVPAVGVPHDTNTSQRQGGVSPTGRGDETHEHFAGEFASAIDRLSADETKAGREPHPYIAQTAAAIRDPTTSPKELKRLADKVAGLRAIDPRHQALVTLTHQAAHAERHARLADQQVGLKKADTLHWARDAEASARGAIAAHAKYMAMGQGPSGREFTGRWGEGEWK